MAKWSDGFINKDGTRIKEALKRTVEGLYSKSSKIESVDTSNLSEEEVAELQRLKKKSESASRVIKG